MSFKTILQTANKDVSNVREFIDNKATALVSPKSARGINGWVFDIPNRDNVEINADITDHVVESGAFISDHIVRKPIRITLSGLIGELVSDFGGVEGSIQTLTNRLDIIDALLGDYTPGMVQKLQGIVSQAEEKISEINTFIDKTQNVVSLLTGEDASPTRQQKMYQDLKALFETNAVVTVQTPWDYFESMMIENISITQDEISEYVSDISITLKEVRFAELKFSNYDERLRPPRVEVQGEGEQDQGTAKGSNNTLLLDIAARTGVIEVEKE